MEATIPEALLQASGAELTNMPLVHLMGCSYLLPHGFWKSHCQRISTIAEIRLPQRVRAVLKGVTHRQQSIGAIRGMVVRLA